MKQNPNFHALPHQNHWAVRRHGANRATKLYRTQDEAWVDAQWRATKTGGKAYLFDRSGQVRRRIDCA